MKHTITYLTFAFATAIVLSSCSAGKYSTAQVYEDDDIYYTAGDIYISEAEADHYQDYVSENASNAPQNAANATSDDYYNEDSNVTVNNYYGSNAGYMYYHPSWNLRPGFSFGYNSWGGSYFGFNNFYPFSGGYIYGYSIWGTPIYTPYYSAWYGGYGGWNCYNPFNPYGFGYGGYYGYNGWGNGFYNGWGGNDFYAGDNYHYTPRPSLQSNSTVNSNYTAGTVYSPIRVQERLNPLTNRPGLTVEQKAENSSTRPMSPATPDRNVQSVETRPNSTEQNNNRPNTGWDAIFSPNRSDRNSNQGTRPNNNSGRTQPSRPSGGNSGGTRPSSPSRGSSSGSSSRSKSSGSSSRKR